MAGCARDRPSFRFDTAELLAGTTKYQIVRPDPEPILDCDVYGPDIPMTMGLTGEPEALGKKLLPKERYGVKTMSIGYLLRSEV